MANFREITRLNDDLLPPWLNLYETAFPPEERILVSVFLQFLKEGQEHFSTWEMLCYESDNHDLLGMAFYEVMLELKIASLWYLAIDPGYRSSGLGGEMYQEICSRVRHAGCNLLVFEVEIPEIASDNESRSYAERRIRFYQRNGAFLIKGISYLQSVGSHQPKIPMHLMVHPIQPFPVLDEVFAICKGIYGDDLTQVGRIILEGNSQSENTPG